MASDDDSQAISLATLKRGLSEPRLEAYRLRPDDSPKAVFGRYRFNVALCESFYYPLHLLEVLLRNTLHRSIATHYANNAAWYDRIPAVLMPREQDAIYKAKEMLRKGGKPEEADRLVAELSFGFWASLLGTDYEQVLWPRLLVSAFPRIPRGIRTRKRIAHRLHSIRLLRNKAFHFEKICMRPDLRQIHEEILETISWIEPEFLKIPPVGETFIEVYARGAAAYEIEIA
jgi:hypothetical protein